jgi:hypothetical protein
MSVSAGSIQQRINDLFDDTTDVDLFPANAITTSIEAALLWHAQFKPRYALYMGTGDGSTAIFSLPSDLIDIRSVEMPYGGTPTEWIQSTDWEEHQGTVDVEIVFDTSPGSAEVFAVHYSGEWTLDTAPSKAAIPLSYLACSFLCMRQSTRMAGHLHPAITAEVVNYQSLSGQWIRLSDHFLTMYSQTVGVSAKNVREGAPPPAFAIGEVPSKNRYDRFWWITE